MDFTWRIFSAFLCAVSITAHAQNCASDRAGEGARIAYVYDGDTVKLNDDRRVRLIGIDTPEISHNGAPSQPFAEQASHALSKLLAANPRVRLRLDADHRDKYYRLLAHLFLQDGRSVEAWLLERGLGTVLVIPPNVWNLTCYQAAERRARSAHLGIWSLPSYQPADTGQLTAGIQGFRLVKGRVVRVGKSRKSIWLNLTGNVALRIDREDLRYFQDQNLEQMEGRQVIARGWLYPRKQGWTMRIRHPAALE